jgi:hypothetical protein
MKLNNIKSWKTTVLGIILIIASIVSVFVKEVQWSDAVIGIGVGLVLLFSPDTILNKFGNFIKIAILIFMTSCVSHKKLAKLCSERFPISDSTVILERVDTTFRYIPGDSIRVPFYVQGEVIYKDTICPPVKVANVLRVKEKVVYQENTSKVANLENIISTLKADLNQSEKQVNDLKSKNKELEKLKRQVNGFVTLLVLLILIIIAIKTKSLWL